MEHKSNEKLYLLGFDDFHHIHQTTAALFSFFLMKFNQNLKMKIFIGVLCSILLGLKVNSQPKTDKIIGIWQVDNTNLIEEWKKTSEEKYEGYSAIIEFGKVDTLEFLTLQKTDSIWVYTAKVLNQNEGKPISFQQIEKNHNNWVFENLNHNFPNTINYTFKADTEIEVTVSGLNGKSFKQKLIKK